MRFLYLLLVAAIGLYSCDTKKEASSSLKGSWEAFHLTSSGNAVPDYLVEDFTLTFKEDGQYEGQLDWLQLKNKGTYNLTGDQLILEKDTFAVIQVNADTLVLHYESQTVPFEIKMRPQL